VFGVIAVDQVLHYAPRLEEIDGLAVREGIGQCWDAAIGVDGAEPWLFLGVLADVDLVGLVGDAVGCYYSRKYCLKNSVKLYVPKLFESDGNLDAVWRLSGVKRDIGVLCRHDCLIYGKMKMEIISASVSAQTSREVLVNTRLSAKVGSRRGAAMTPWGGDRA
jgi:hypothetical protein